MLLCTSECLSEDHLKWALPVCGLSLIQYNTIIQYLFIYLLRFLGVTNGWLLRSSVIHMFKALKASVHHRPPHIYKNETIDKKHPSIRNTSSYDIIPASGNDLYRYACLRFFLEPGSTTASHRGREAIPCRNSAVWPWQ